jgi:hypothetical protein
MTMNNLPDISPNEDIRFDFGVGRDTLHVEDVYSRPDIMWCLVVTREKKLGIIVYQPNSINTPGCWTLLLRGKDYSDNDSIREKFQVLKNGGLI